MDEAVTNEPVTNEPATNEPAPNSAPGHGRRGEGRDVSMVTRLALDDLGHDRFRSATATDHGHVFGGLLVGQAVRAAQRTVPAEDPIRSLHASFVLAGRPDTRVELAVERTRDGSSFATRRVVASQGDRIVLVLTADFHREEDGPEYQVPPVAEVPGPAATSVGRYDSPWFESRDVAVEDAPSAPPLARRTWYRARVPLPDDPAVHLAALAYLSDHGPTRSAREPHRHLADDARRVSVSLDHSVWFHRPTRVDRWLQYELVPISTARGRGLSIGTIREEDGNLVATVAQEVVLRVR